MRVTIFDYGAGNLHSLAKALSVPDVVVRIDADVTRVLDTDLLVLPGVGAFAAAAARIAPGRASMRAAIDDGLPCLGICLGMQLLFDESEEGSGHGLGVVAGRVTRLHARRTPQIGWNTIEQASDPLFRESGLDIAYYANSYVCRPNDDGDVVAWSTHEDDRFAAAVRRARTLGAQFHPEKSSSAGVRFIHSFIESVRP